MKLEKRELPAATDKAGDKKPAAVLFNLDAPAEIADSIKDSKKPNTWLLGSIGAILLLMAVAVLWAVIPRKSDMMDSRN